MLCEFCPTIVMSAFFQSDVGEIYFQCPSCFFIHKDKKSFLKPDEENSRYEDHENDVNDPRYINFLKPLIDQMEIALGTKIQSRVGLDFGCGKAAPLEHVFAQKGYAMEKFDPHFFPEIPLQKFDFILASEVVEHFKDPKKDFSFMDSLLKKGGLLGLMSSWWTPQIDFKSWYYRRDPTHVSFYSDKTLAQIAMLFNYEIKFLSVNTCILQKLT